MSWRVGKITMDTKQKVPPEVTKRKNFSLSNEKIQFTDNVISSPREPSIEELLNTGVINLNKPMGPTSHQVSSWVKNIFGVEKLGHGGTLDPRVTGVLPLAFGKSTKLLDIFKYASKEYVGIMRLHQDVTLKKIIQVSKDFIGQIYQMPPVRSAVKRQLRVRTIYSLEILEQKKRDVLFRVESEAGTYIRTLVNDIGTVLGKGAHMQELRRTRSGIFIEKDSVTLHDLKDSYIFWQEERDDSLLRNCILPKEILLGSLPRVVIHDTAVDAICHGAELAIPGIIQFDDLQKFNEPVAILTRSGEGVAIGQTKILTKDLLNLKNGIAIKPTRVLMEPGKYKKGWKRKNK